MGFDPDDPSTHLEEDPKAPYLAVYLELRNRVGLHMQQHLLPELGLSLKPVGALDWQPDTLPADEIELASYQEDSSDETDG